MSRQILTFLFIFLGLMLVMRGCPRGEDLPPAVLEYPVARGGDEELLELADAESGLTVELARNGTLATLLDDRHSVIRSTPAWARPLSVWLVAGGGQRTSIPDQNWTPEPLPEGEGRGFRFTGTREGLVVRKTVKLADGGGLDVKLEVEGAGEDLVGIWMTAASGVPLPADGGAETRSGVFWGVAGGRPELKTFDALAQSRARERAKRARAIRDGAANVADRHKYAVRRELAPKTHVDRFGVLGQHHYVAFENLPETSELLADGYYAVRDGSKTPEIESWLELIPREGAYSGEFRLRWKPREDASVVALFGPLEEKTASFWLEDDAYRVEFSDKGAAIRAMWLKKFVEDAGVEPTEETWLPMLRRAVRSGDRPLTLAGDADRYGEDPARAIWKSVDAPDARSIRFELETRKGWRFVKTVRLPEPGRYDFGVEIEVAPPAGASASDAKLTLVGPAGSYIADAYRGIIGAGHPEGVLLERSGGEDDDLVIDKLNDNKELRHEYHNAGEQLLLKSVAVRGAYFVCALVMTPGESEKPSIPVTEAVLQGLELERAIERTDGGPSKQSIIGRVTCMVPLEGGRGKLDVRLYAGPNNPADLRALDIADTVDYGVFGIIGRFLMWLLKVFYGLFGNYGPAIAMLTVVVRACLLPVSYKTQLGMQRYQKRIAKIKPILDELGKKYEKNSQKLNQERMRVMREHGVGLPLGCLTMFLQIPIWFALFQALRVEFAIRHQPFLWAADLSMPDQLFALPFWPHQFNLFPILMLVLWVAQQKIAPQAGSDDPQVKTQMKMMKFMPYMFFIFLYKYAAALAVYMCVSSLWSIAEGKLVRRAIAGDTHRSASA